MIDTFLPYRGIGKHPADSTVEPAETLVCAVKHTAIEVDSAPARRQVGDGEGGQYVRDLAALPADGCMFCQIGEIHARRLCGNA